MLARAQVGMCWCGDGRIGPSTRAQRTAGVERTLLPAAFDIVLDSVGALACRASHPSC